MKNKNTSTSSSSSKSTIDVMINGTKFADCFTLKGNYMYCYFASAKKAKQSIVKTPNLILKLNINTYACNGYKSHVLFYS